MAIVQASLAEEILSRQERAVIRGIYRASQLAEALNALNKTVSSLPSSGSQIANTNGGLTDTKTKEQVVKLTAYLACAIESALINTNVPASVSVKKDKPSQQI